MINELIDILITALFAGFIMQPLTKSDYWTSVIISGLSIVLHELGHKITAMFFGFTAVYHANINGLIIGSVLRLMNFPVFIVPAYVQISGGSGIGLFFTAIAGPLTNLLIFIICYSLLKYSDNYFITSRSTIIAVLGSINLWLGILNLMPIPGFDGFNALMSLWLMH